MADKTTDKKVWLVTGASRGMAALRELVKDAPAPVIARALCFHHTTTTRQGNHAGVTWNRYPASRGRWPAGQS